MRTKEGSTKIVNFTTQKAGVLVGVSSRRLKQYVFDIPSDYFHLGNTWASKKKKKILVRNSRENCITYLSMISARALYFIFNMLYRLF